MTTFQSTRRDSERTCGKQFNSRSDLLRQGLSILCRKLKSEELVRIGSSATGHFSLERASGYTRSRGTGQHVTIRADKFKSWFDDPRQPRLVLEWLRSKNALPARPAVPTKGGTGIVWAESQPTWPDGSRRRSVEITILAGLFASLKG
jgi:hypothetical protein